MELALKRLSYLALALVLMACASTTPTISNTQPVPASEIVAYQTPSATTGAVHIFRDEAFAGGARRFLFLVDNKQILTIGVGERVTLHLPEGDRFLEVKLSGPQFLVTPGESLLLGVKAGSDYYFRINSDGSSIRLHRVAPAAVGVQ